MTALGCVFWSVLQLVMWYKQRVVYPQFRETPMRAVQRACFLDWTGASNSGSLRKVCDEFTKSFTSQDTPINRNCRSVQVKTSRHGLHTYLLHRKLVCNSILLYSVFPPGCPFHSDLLYEELVRRGLCDVREWRYWYSVQKDYYSEINGIFHLTSLPLFFERVIQFR